MANERLCHLQSLLRGYFLRALHIPSLCAARFKKRRLHITGKYPQQVTKKRVFQPRAPDYGNNVVEKGAGVL